MTRGEIGNYLRLTVETVSRLLSRFQSENLITVEGKLISLDQVEQLRSRAKIAVSMVGGSRARQFLALPVFCA